jgi:hypothetical protein
MEIWTDYAVPRNPGLELLGATDVLLHIVNGLACILALGRYVRPSSGTPDLRRRRDVMHFCCLHTDASIRLLGICKVLVALLILKFRVGLLRICNSYACSPWSVAWISHFRHQAYHHNHTFYKVSSPWPLAAHEHRGGSLLLYMCQIQKVCEPFNMSFQT